jgi:hypothetical protein
MNSPLRHRDSALRSKATVRPSERAEFAIGLTAALLAISADEPVVAVRPSSGEGQSDDGMLPCGLFAARDHATLEDGLQSWVQAQTGLTLNFAQQLCTVANRVPPNGREHWEAGPLVISICYLSLIGPQHIGAGTGIAWRSWYTFFPWEDWRHGRPECLTREIEPRLLDWAKTSAAPGTARAPLSTHQRIHVAFGLDGAPWDEEKVLDRYELLCEAGIVGGSLEASEDAAARAWRLPRLQDRLLGDHARVLARAVTELRRMSKYRPVVFELMPELFTLFELQKAVEAILGPHLHKQNFRRLVESGGLVEPTGDYRYRTGGRPAQLYRFRQHVLLERPALGMRVRTGRA